MQKIEFKIEDQLFKKIFNEIPDPASLWYRTDEGRIILAMTNQAALETSNGRISEFIGYSVEEFYLDNIQVIKTIIQVIGTGKNIRIELRIKLRTTGEWKWFLSDYVKVDNSYVLNIAKDITDRKNVEKALSESEERFRILVEQSPDGIGIIQDGVINFINKATVKMLRAKNETEIIGHSFTEFVQKDSFEEIKKYYLRVSSESTPQTIEIRFKTIVGKIFFVEIISKKIIYKGREAIQFIIRDITKRVATEIQLRNLTTRLRSLTTHIQTLVEEEKIKIAREIHDELAQALTGLKIDLTFLQEMSEENIDKNQIKIKIKSMIELIDTTIKTVRRISTELRPIILDKLGLIAAIEWLVEDIQKRTSIKFQCSLPKEVFTLDEKLSTALFRIFQESITNILRHSFATKVNISMLIENYCLHLKIRDNGIGIEQENIDNINSLGIFGMKERVRELKGSIKINGKKGMGTLVMIEIPLEKNQLKKGRKNDQHINCG
ncbi:MAG: PAS domain S-box protein [Bacteroidetes bacterium]|nr:PAS domain S-box protein [Bacteroidota bacterium]